jgi:hypothetical protein
MLVQNSADRGAHISSMSLVVIYSIWFGSIARLSQWGRGGSFTCPWVVSTCLRGGYRRGRGWIDSCGSTWIQLPLRRMPFIEYQAVISR